MRNKLLWVDCMLCALLVSGCSNAEHIVLTRDGNPSAVIVISDDTAEQSAALELQSYVRKMSGAVIPVVTEAPSGNGNSVVYIANNRVVDGFVAGTGDLTAGGFKIVTNGNRLLLLGKDDDGTAFSVCHVLETWCGVRWFMPGLLGEAAPEMETVAIDAVNVTENPDFLSRHYLGDDAEQVRWLKHNKMGEGLTIHGVHAFGEIAPPERYFQSNPEYYALVKGQRWATGTPGMESWHGWQLCTTNPDVIELSIQYARKTFDENPSINALSINPNDAGNFCECERCTALDTGETDETGRPVLSDRIFTYANAVADGLRESHPDKLVLILAYAYYRNLPKNVKPRDNVLVQYAYSGALTVDPAQRQLYHDMLTEWGRISKQMIIYEYYMNWSWPQIPRPITARIAEELPFLKSTGVIGFYPQTADDWASNGVNYYLASKLLWDTSQDASKILDDYYDKFYGKSGPAMRRYSDAFEAAWKEVVASGLSQSNHLWRAEWLCHIYTPKMLAACKQYLDQAEQAAENTAIRERVNFMRAGFTHTELAMAMYRDLVALAEMDVCTLNYWGSIRTVNNVEKNNSEANAALTKTRESIQQFQKNCELLKDSQAISFSLLRRNVLKAVENNLEKIEELLARM